MKTFKEFASSLIEATTPLDDDDHPELGHYSGQAHSSLPLAHYTLSRHQDTAERHLANGDVKKASAAHKRATKFESDMTKHHGHDAMHHMEVAHAHLGEHQKRPHPGIVKHDEQREHHLKKAVEHSDKAKEASNQHREKAIAEHEKNHDPLGHPDRRHTPAMFKTDDMAKERTHRNDRLYARKLQHEHDVKHGKRPQDYVAKDRHYMKHGDTRHNPLSFVPIKKIHAENAKKKQDKHTAKKITGSLMNILKKKD